MPCPLLAAQHKSEPLGHQTPFNVFGIHDEIFILSSFIFNENDVLCSVGVIVVAFVMVLDGGGRCSYAVSCHYFFFFA